MPPPPPPSTALRGSRSTVHTCSGAVGHRSLFFLLKMSVAACLAAFIFNHRMLAPLDTRAWCACGLSFALLILASCAPLTPIDSVRLMIAHPVNGSISSSRNTRLLLSCAGACDGRTALVTFSNGDNLQVHPSAFSFSFNHSVAFKCGMVI